MTPVAYRPITDAAVWNAFAESLTPNTFLHSWEWGQVQQNLGEPVTYWGVFTQDTLIGIALTIQVNARRGPHLLIPHGPLFATPELTTTHLPGLITHLTQVAKQANLVAIRIAPLLETSPDVTNTFKNLHFRSAPLHVHAERTWARDINPAPDAILKDMRKTTRHAVKKAHKEGITTEVVTDASAVDRFWPLYETTRTRHDFVPYSRPTLHTQFKVFSATNRVYGIIARYDNRDVAAGIFFTFGNTAFYYHGASRKLPARLPATQLVQWAAMQEAKQRGLTRYNFWGIAPDNQPNHPFAGITTFKKGFGGRVYNYHHAQDLPVSLRYARLWAVEMFRKHRRGF